MFAGPLKIAVGAAAVAFVAANLLSYRTAMPPRPAAEGMGPAPPADDRRLSVSQAASYGRVELTPDRFGQYHADVEIDGRRLPMLVDTGASFVALTYADASALGLQPMPSDFNIKITTANGLSFAARVRLHEVRLDTIDVADVPAIVVPKGAMATSLLGMSFLEKLGSFAITDGDLVLKP
jgi:aspartyl protease family protein